MERCKESEAKNLLNFLQESSTHEDIVAMDCNDYCETLSHLAERVAAGDDLRELLPALEEHMRYWSDCREEFEALVAVIRAEIAGTAPTTAPATGE